MNEVVALRNTPGLKKGQTGPKERWMDSHILAGNIKVLPIDDSAPEPVEAPAPILATASTGSYDATIFDDVDVDTAGTGDEEE